MAEKIEYFHGSTSASFEGVLGFEGEAVQGEFGLKSLQTLINDNRVPFAGEANYGQIDPDLLELGLISVVEDNGIDQAVKHSKRLSLWNPNEAKNELELLRGAHKRALESESPDLADIFKCGSKFKSMQIERWSKISKTLSDEQRELILRPFSVIYRFETDEEGLIIPSQFCREFGVPGPIKTNDLTIYTPSSKLVAVERLCNKGGHTPDVKSFNTLYAELMDRRDCDLYRNRVGSILELTQHSRQ